MPKMEKTDAEEAWAIEEADRVLGPQVDPRCTDYVAAALLLAQAKALKEFHARFYMDPAAAKYTSQMEIQAHRLEEAAKRINNGR